MIYSVSIEKGCILPWDICFKKNTETKVLFNRISMLRGYLCWTSTKPDEWLPDKFLKILN